METVYDVWCHRAIFPDTRDAHFAIHVYRAVLMRRIHRQHRGQPSSAFAGFYFYAGHRPMVGKLVLKLIKNTSYKFSFQIKSDEFFNLIKKFHV